MEIPSCGGTSRPEVGACSQARLRASRVDAFVRELPHVRARRASRGDCSLGRALSTPGPWAGQRWWRPAMASQSQLSLQLLRQVPSHFGLNSGRWFCANRLLSHDAQQTPAPSLPCMRVASASVTTIRSPMTPCAPEISHVPHTTALTGNRSGDSPSCQHGGGLGPPAFCIPRPQGFVARYGASS